MRVQLARFAMATRFELVLEGDDEVWLRAAGEEALTEIERLESQLSIFRPTSEISRVNARASEEAVRVEPRLFALLQRAEKIYRLTRGAFDPSVAPLMRAWGFFRDSGRMPDPHVLEEARSRTGMDLVELDPDSRTVRFRKPGVMLDFGGIGKGYAIDEAVSMLKEIGVESALLHGGTSTVVGYGPEPWKIAVPYPGIPDEGGSENVLSVVSLENAALSVSAVWGKSFEVEGKTYGHVLDPRLGKPVDGAVLAAAVLENATEADAISTALLVLGRDALELPEAIDGLKMILLLQGSESRHYEVIEAGLAALPSNRVIFAPPLGGLA